MNAVASAAAWPLVSVIVPMRNEARHIGACLDAILAQDYPADRMEVLVVDGMSDDAAPAIVRAYGARDPRVRLLSNPGRIVPTAMNIGICAAGGTIIARVDGHTRIAVDYLRVGVEALGRTGADNVGGPMRSVGGGEFGDAVARAMSSRFGIGAYFHYGTEEREVDTVYLGLWPRAVLERIGLFDEEFVRNQDDELNYRLRKAGGRVVLVPAMRSQYQNRQGARALARQFYQYGFWKVPVLQRHPRQMSWRHFVPPLFIAGLVTLAAAGFWWPAAGALAAGIGATYVVAVLVVARRLTGGRSAGAWLTTALAFSIIHWAWGSGFLVGLLRCGHRWRRNRPPVTEPHGRASLRRAGNEPGNPSTPPPNAPREEAEQGMTPGGLRRNT